MVSEENSVGTFLQVQFNKAIINKLVNEHHIPMDILGTVCFILIALDENKIDLLDCLDDNNKTRKAALLYRQLMFRGLLEFTTPDDNSFYRLSLKGKELVVFLKKEFSEEILSTVKSIPSKKAVEVHAEDLEELSETESEDVSSWIVDYVNLFPIKNSDNRMLRMHELTALGKMRLFIRRYKYTKDTILSATELYIKMQELNDSTHKYTKNSTNFIQKYGTGIESELASWCKRFLEGEFEDNNTTNFNTSILDTI